MQSLTVIDGYLTEDLRSYVHGQLVGRHLPHSTFGIAKSMLDAGEAERQLSAYFDAPMAKFFSDHARWLLADAGLASAEGIVEFWKRELTPGSRARFFHQDLDMARRDRDRVRVSASRSSILHLTGGAVLGGSTWFGMGGSRSDFQFIDEFVELDELRSRYPSAVAVAPEPGRLVVFDGAIGHMVDDVHGGAVPRVTLLAVVFERSATFPQAEQSVSNLSTSEYELLASLPEATLKAVRLEAYRRQVDGHATEDDSTFLDLGGIELLDLTNRLATLPVVPG